MLFMAMHSLIRLATRFAPRQWLQLLSPVVLPVLAFLYRGKRFACPIDGRRYRSFLPYGRITKRPNALCPGCLSLERHRLLWLFLQRKTDFFTRPFRLLHIAPELCFVKRFAVLPRLDYTTADLDSPLADLRMDVENMPVGDDQYDAVICNHVLEHVDDDRKALAEIFRVLRPGGWAILQSPVYPDLPRTLEDPKVTSPAERERLYGQRDHRRKYGRDYAGRIRQAGFRVQEEAFIDELSAEEILRCALPENEIIYFCLKPAAVSGRSFS
jgi:SAM-dependent methyltransferase